MNTKDKEGSDSYRYEHFKTKVIYVGDVALGGNNPIRIQSMTNTNTLDTAATVAQSIRMIEAGCEFVRITTPGLKEAENLVKIKKELHAKGYTTPLIADVHFNPAVAEYAARVVEKVRINPGNYIDRKIKGKIKYTDKEYADELYRIRNRILPLLKICKEYGTVIRIGTNHGSLSDRIVNRYGNTSQGMVESALEFIRICEDEGFEKLVLSMKSSNIIIMVNAYRQLVQRMFKEGMNYPLHVGVTEAGSGDEGRIKSAAGIGALLEDGIGDTIRVSLSEPPEAEIPAARILVNRYGNKHRSIRFPVIKTTPFGRTEIQKNHSREVLNVGNDNLPVVIVTAGKVGNIKEADYVFTGGSYEKDIFAIINSSFWKSDYEQSYPIFTVKKYFRAKKKSTSLNFINVTSEELTPAFLEKIKDDLTAVLVMNSGELHGAVELRNMMSLLKNTHCICPVIVRRSYIGLSPEEFRLYASSDVALLQVEGYGDGIWLEAKGISPQIIEKVSFDILQATGSRIVKTEYISCPTCGRTSFDLMETLERVKLYTSHLKGLKIAIMGCVVNGPGEMADADYGYVGSSPGKINLYKGKDLVRRNINEEEALDALIKLLKENRDWIERD